MKSNNSKYSKKYPALVEELARQNLGNSQIAAKLGISSSTFYVWLKKYPALDKALRDGRREVDLEVENALLKRALGFEYEEFVDQSGSVKKTRKMMAPDVRAAIFWLKHRRPELWDDDYKGKVANEAEVEKFKLLVDSMSHEEKVKLLKQLVDGNEQNSGN